MLIPARVSVPALRGATFDITIVLFMDEAQTERYDWTGAGQSVEVDVGGVGVLSAGSGLTLTPAIGQIVMKLTPAQTLTLQEATHFQVKLITTATGDVNFPLVGSITASDP